MPLQMQWPLTSMKEAPCPPRPPCPSQSLWCSFQCMEQSRCAQEVRDPWVGPPLALGAAPEDTGSPEAGSCSQEGGMASAASQATAATTGQGGYMRRAWRTWRKSHPGDTSQPFQFCSAKHTRAAAFLGLHVLMELSEAGLGRLPGGLGYEQGSGFAKVGSSSAIDE